MTYSYTSSTDSLYLFPSTTDFEAATERTYVFNIKVNSAATTSGNNPYIFYLKPGGEETYIIFNPGWTPGTAQLQFDTKWTGGLGLGLWTTPAPAVGSVTNIAITYSSASASNDPVIYYNLISQTITERRTPSGSFVSGASSPRIGSVLFLSGEGDYELYNFLAFNRILSSAELSDIYNSRLAIPNYRGLIFAPDLRGASNSNYIKDYISGTTGDPFGTPIVVPDTYLNWK